MILNAAVPGDDQPVTTGGLRDPHFVQRGWIGDGAWVSDAAALHLAARISGIDDVTPDQGKDLGETQQVGVDVIGDLGRSRPFGHEARAEVS